MADQSDDLAGDRRDDLVGAEGAISEEMTPDQLAEAKAYNHLELLCGLADQAHLSKLFRREIGDTPGAWRRRNLWRDPNGRSRDFCRSTTVLT